jgi:type 1 fimbria pilin
MKRIFLIGLIMVMVALTVIPFAAYADTSGSTPITGQVAPATISITAPSAVNLGRFIVGDLTGHSSTPATVIVTAGTAGYPAEGVAYSVLAVDSNTGAGKGFMMNGTTQLSTTNKFMIGSDGINYVPADEGFSYTGTATNANPINLPFYVKQHIDGSEGLGIYGITITFTVSLP